MSKITALRTLRIQEHPNLIWVELETEDGLIGLGESFRGAAAVEALLHAQIAPSLIGQCSTQIEAISYQLMTPYLGFNSSGTEVRAASAVDIALWDLAGQRLGVPIHTLLGGKVRDRIPVYNTCAGYSFNTSGNVRRNIGADDRPSGPYDDQIAFMRDAGALAQSLLEEGYGAMKIWPFDVFAPSSNGQLLTLEQLKKGLEPFRKIRQAVGDKIEVMCELHSLFGTHAATRICQALEEFNVYWVEDPLNKMDNAQALADLRRRTRVPICGSETLGSAKQFNDLLSADAIDIVMLDLAWCGGVSEGRKIASLAQLHGKPLAPHDCTGPVTLMAGLHLGVHAPTAIFQEVVRATLATWYRDLVTELPVIEHGAALAPTLPGLGTKLTPKLRHREDLIERVSGKSRLA
ncbi:TPA: mandelate racemase/muconate lactonizing enzyme family protein [Pseudomonas putida]|uniref:mandelate racemase/muconate lactonizing enzyme family protein n=1 Tax=Pseudomonas putida TaxID=303 RepID=UPI0023640E8E|nr:mandelate racemase/muconate lactonizing enzyme family protein [Pseudomonas putida]MDD2076533.1 mandelate racemase/muconate lactonizing enzyme family protein [Pseudomonas putida]HDS1692429.1 mandelate racemase/muconate lactonizing enzyme family protein [Pseudomonas putida]